MSMLIDQQQEWNVAPGWTIHADLTPPEVATGRRLKVVRRGVLVALAVFVVLLTLLYIAAWDNGHRAASDLTRAQATTQSLRVEQDKYSAVVDIQGSIGSIKKQLAGLMTGDVDVAKLVQSFRSSLPPGMKIGQIQISLTPTTSSQTGAVSASGGSSLDTSDQQAIGSITINGSARHFTDLAKYATGLRSLDGIIDVDPESNISDKSNFQFTVVMTVTDARLTHQYDSEGTTNK